MTLSPVNMDSLNEIMDNDAELIQECFEDFLADYPGMIGNLKSAAADLDFEEIDNTAHTLKGTLRYLAAEPAAQSALAVETAGRHQDPENLEQKISALEDRCRAVIQYIKEFLA
ncbi:MAG: Hpt domain-containing protein [Desulfobacter sp.]|nr:MAG: Hpt domain-containing protein [Desulfobacter sp.]